MNTKLHSVFLFYFCFFSSFFCVADDSSDLEQGIEQYYASQFNEAKETLINLAEKNIPEAYYYLGLIFSDNRFKGYDLNSAMAYLLSAADLNHSQAMFKIGLMYDNAEGVEQDPLKALDWYRKAKKSEKINPNIVVTLHEGDKSKKIKFPVIFLNTLKLAETGNAKAQYLVASNYDYGSLIPRDFSKALIWYEKASKNNHSEAKYILGYLYCRGEGVIQNTKLANEFFVDSGRGLTCPD